MQSYFSQREFEATVAAAASQVKLKWLALSGDLTNEEDSSKLEKMIANFLQTRKHRSFQQHQVCAAPCSSVGSTQR